jgi:hypothetical protein
MSWIAIIYLLVHFMLFAGIFRQWEFFRSERGIFFYHIISAITLVMLEFGVFLWRPSLDNLSLVVAAGAVHGIYSLTFLECWSLSQGGYSLQILRELVRCGMATPAELEQRFIDMSAHKKMSRLDSLTHLGLVQAEGDRFRLTRPGRIFANTMEVIVFLADLRGRAER